MWQYLSIVGRWCFSVSLCDMLGAPFSFCLVGEELENLFITTVLIGDVKMAGYWPFAV